MLGMPLPSDNHTHTGTIETGENTTVPSADEQESVSSDHEEHDHVAMTFIINEETARKAEQFRQNLKRLLADRDRHVDTYVKSNVPITMMPDRGNTSLRVVDPYGDEGVWCIVDEGANSNTHGQLWLENAMAKWARKSVRPVLKDATPTSFTGVGTKASSGSYTLPTGFLLQPSNMIVQGSVVSHEMPGSSHPMLLSQSAQALLGFKKDVREGTIKMKDYDDQDLEVVRQHRTGLFMIRMDHIHIERCEELWRDDPAKRDMLIEEAWETASELPEELEASTPENASTKASVHVSYQDDYNIDRTANVVLQADERTAAWQKYDLTRPVVIASAGLMHFEKSEYSNGACDEFTKFLRNKFADRKPRGGWITDDLQAAAIAKRSFRLCFPGLCEGRQVIFLDCSLVKADPGEDGELRGHTGRHWRNLEKFVAHPSFAELNEPLKDINPKANILVVCFCNQGRHRPVAKKKCYTTCSKANGPKDEEEQSRRLICNTNSGDFAHRIV